MTEINGSEVKTSKASIKFKNFRDRSAVEAVRQCLLEEKRSTYGAKKIGMDDASYAFISRMLLLRDRHIPHSHREVIDQALAFVDQYKNTSEAKRLAGGIVSTLWDQTKAEKDTVKNLVKKKKIRRRIDQTLMHIRESCETTRDMRIPAEMTQEEAAEAVASLSRSVELISRLITRLLGRGEET